MEVHTVAPSTNPKIAGNLLLTVFMSNIYKLYQILNGIHSCVVSMCMVLLKSLTFMHIQNMYATYVVVIGWH